MTLRSLGRWHAAKDEVGEFFFFLLFYSRRPGSTQHSSGHFYRQLERDGRELRLGTEAFFDSPLLPC